MAIIESYWALVSGISVSVAGVLNRTERYHFLKNLTLHIRGEKVPFNGPVIMGILNVTPDSFYDGGRHQELNKILDHVEKMLHEGADIIDLGAYSSRPGAKEISPEEEWDRIAPILPGIRKAFPSALISIDTFQVEVAKNCLAEGVSMINDITAGTAQDGMLELLAYEKLPYIMMHMQGNPGNMQDSPTYGDVAKEVFDFLKERRDAAAKAGVRDIVLDPGFGFGKSLEHNYTLLRRLKEFQQLNCPILVGISRKSMVNKVLGVNAKDALNGSSALHAVALLNGADILRVHDVKEAKEVVKIVSYLQKE